MPQRSLTKSEKRLYIGSAFLVAVPLGVGVLIHNANRDPDWLTPPARHVPNPNGYDLYLKASSAFVTFNPAVDPILDTNPPPAAGESTRYSLARRRQWVKVNAPAFTLIHQAQSMPVAKPALTSPLGFRTWSSFRQMARYKVVEAKTYADAGQHGKAFAAGLDAVQMGVDCAKDGGMIDTLVDFAIRALGYGVIEDNLPRLTAPEALAFATRTQRILDGATTYRQAMGNEKWIYLDMLKVAMKDGSWRKLATVPRFSFTKRLAFALKTKRSVYAETVAWNDYYTKLAGLGYKASLQPPNVPSDGIAVTLSNSPYFRRWQVLSFDNLVYLRMLIIRLRLRAYQQQTGHFPASLKDLQGLPPADLEDPFLGSGQPLHYRANGNVFTLWSVGPDAADNNGRPIRKLRPGFSSADENSVGDLVTPLPQADSATNEAVTG